MSHLYQRPSDRSPVYWEPKNIKDGKTAIKNVLEKTPNSYPVEVSDKQADQIREEYQRLIEQKQNSGSTQ